MKPTKPTIRQKQPGGRGKCLDRDSKSIVHTVELTEELHGLLGISVLRERSNASKVIRTAVAQFLDTPSAHPQRGQVEAPYHYTFRIPQAEADRLKARAAFEGCDWSTAVRAALGLLLGATEPP